MRILFKDGKLPLSESHRPDDLKILFTGDLCPQYRPMQKIFEGKAEDVISPVLHVLSDKDLSITNMEAAVTTRETPIAKSGSLLKVDPKCVDLIKAAGFDVANLANNHIGDYGCEAVLETAELFEENGIRTVGAGRDIADARKPLFITKKNIKTAILSFAENQFGMAGDETPGASPFNIIENLRQIREVSEKADITLVLVHYGNEYCPVPSPGLVEIYHEFAEAGASAIIGTHPHCPQGMEVHKGVPIIYSLGNFMFDIEKVSNRERFDRDKFWWKSFMAAISFNRDGATMLEVFPHTFHGAQSVRLFENEEKERFIKYIEHISGILQDETELKMLNYAFCAKMGPVYLKYFQNVKDTLAEPGDEAYRSILPIRVILSSEPTNELVTSYFRMIHEDKIRMGLQYIDRLDKLTEGIIE